MTRILCLFAAAALATGAAHAQTQVVQTQNVVSPVLEVQRLAPQLVQFAGGDVNFANLVNGLSFGLPVTLTTPIAAGVTQVVSFTPTGSLAPLQIAQLLETARQTGIANGIATPTAEQIAVILNGGALPTASGTTTLTGLISGTASAASVAATMPTSPAALLQSQRSFSISNSPFPRGISDTRTSTTSTTIGATTSTTATIGTTAAQPMVTPGTSAAAGATGATTTRTPPFAAR